MHGKAAHCQPHNCVYVAQGIAMPLQFRSKDAHLNKLVVSVSDLPDLVQVLQSSIQ